MHAAVLAMALSGCECGGESSDDAGTPILWHVDNHGSNSWNFLELSVTGEAPCAELDGAVP